MAKNRLLAWQLWFHYLVLEAIILLALELTNIEIPTAIDIGILYLAIAIGDQAIHAILGATTGWKD